MSNVIRFPADQRAGHHGSSLLSTPIPREQFAALAELALDVVDRIVALLDAADGDPDLEPDADGEPSLAAPVGGPSQIGWARGGDQDLEE
ncbi:MAG: hypothetical protein K2X71_06325 [Methylobacterium sp.]|uniref:hypothetical protein n=1 Tax=Methylobacterium sp. TaxID=409 RepID=UPI00258674FA|nr:hypothetical protein [Methylobacterium sp.]MBY0295641.1 hypothetical protein [Methylobacterium sp.]